MNFKWQDKVTNFELLQHAKLPSMITMISNKRLRWLWHAAKMNDCHIPKEILYNEHEKARRLRGGLKLRYNDISALREFFLEKNEKKSNHMENNCVRVQHLCEEKQGADLKTKDASKKETVFSSQTVLVVTVD